MNVQRLFAVAVLAVTTAGAAGCSEFNESRGKGDAPVASQDDTETHVINFPDGFMNVAFKCHGAVGIYSHTRAAAPAVVPDHPECRR